MSSSEENRNEVKLIEGKSSTPWLARRRSNTLRYTC